MSSALHPLSRYTAGEWPTDHPTATNSVCLCCQLAVAALARRREETLRQRAPEDQNRAHYMRGTVMWHLHRARHLCAHGTTIRTSVFHMLRWKAAASLC